MFEVNNKGTKAVTSFCSRVDRSKALVPSNYLFKINNRGNRKTCKIGKAYNKDIGTRSMSAFSCLYCYL